MAKAIPGGGRWPAAKMGKDGKFPRGDLHMKNPKPSNLAQRHGQDLMRGEHRMKTNKLAPGGTGANSALAEPRTVSVEAKYKKSRMANAGIQDTNEELRIDGDRRQSKQENLTWVKGARENLDDTSRKNLAAGRQPAMGNLPINSVFAPSEDAGNEQSQTGTSIFDPVLCELAYKWFCPPGGSILDPFAGGSVRGIVAAILGYQYTGIDLRPEQVAANKQQADRILTRGPGDEVVPVKVSEAMARLRFNGCDPEYIRTTCHATCCESSTSTTGTLITIHPTEQPAIESQGGQVIDGLLQPLPGCHKCPFKTTADLCGLHDTPDKPFGCIASPFTLNKNGTLIVRNRYKLLKCYDDGNKLPAYVAFRASLDLLFGSTEAERICKHFADGGGDIIAPMSRLTYQKLIDNDAIKHGSTIQEPPRPHWIVGDSRDSQALAPGEYDFIFSCPPYGDLEVYSDDPRDLSTLDYEQFLAKYREIIAQSLTSLKPNRFACFVVGDFRDSHGYYRNFVSETIRAFQDAGMTLYNEAILVTAVGSLPIRIGRQFGSYRKLGKTHQNVLVFYRGNVKAIPQEFGTIEVPDLLPPASPE